MPADAIGEGVRAEALRDTVYLMGGHNSDGWSYDSTKRSLYGYDLASDTWTKLAPLPAPYGLADMAFAGVEDKLYTFGGFYVDASYSYYFTNDAYPYDPSSDTRRSISPLSGAARPGVAAAVLRRHRRRPL